MAKIIRAVLPLTYTFTGDDRDASASLENDAVLSCYDMSGETSGEFVFSASNKDFNPLKISAARLIPSGACGLQAPEGKAAASIVLELGPVGNKNSFTLSFSEFGEWEKKKVQVCLNGNDWRSKATLKSGSKIQLDDYNLQDAYVGETLTVILEIELEV